MPLHFAKALVPLTVLSFIGVSSTFTVSSAIAQTASQTTCKGTTLDRKQDLVVAQEEKCEKIKVQKEKLQKTYTSLLSDTSRAGKLKLKSLKSSVSRTDKQIVSICKKATSDRKKYGVLITACKKFTTPEPTPTPTVTAKPQPSPTPLATPTPSPTPVVTPTPTDTTFLRPQGCVAKSISPAYPGKITLKIRNSRNGTAVEALGEGSSLCATDNLTIFGGDDLTIDTTAELTEGFKLVFDFGEDNTCRERYTTLNFANGQTASLTFGINDCVRGQILKIDILPQGSAWTSNRNGLHYISEKVGSADNNPDPQWFTTANKCTVEFLSDAQPTRPGRIKIEALNLRTQQRSEILLKSGYYCNALSIPYVASRPGDEIELRVAAENAEQVFINVSSAGNVPGPGDTMIPNCPSVANLPNMNFAYSNSVTRHRFTMPQCLSGTEMKFTVQPIGRSWAGLSSASYSAALLEIR